MCMNAFAFSIARPFERERASVLIPFRRLIKLLLKSSVSSLFTSTFLPIMDLLFEGREMCTGWPRIHVPDSCKGVEVVLGIDEAGRGSVLGSLIYTVAFWPKTEHEAICQLGFDDSKQLKEGERDHLADRIKAHGSIGWVIGELPPEMISQDMLKVSPISLNALSYRAVVWMLEQVKDHPNAPIIRDIFVDTVGDPETYKSFLLHNITSHNQDPRDWNFTIEKKDDANYRVVGAASIIAKTMRDLSIKEWVYPENIGAGAVATINKDFGSGYPGDPKCVEWLQQHMHPVFGYPSIARFSWSTVRLILDEHKNKPPHVAEMKWDADDEDSGGAPSIMSFFGGGGDKTTKRSAYFISSGMKHVTPGFCD